MKTEDFDYDLPKELIARANDILNIYEKKEKRIDTKVQECLPLNFEVKDNKAIEHLKQIDPNSLTPIAALNILYELKEEVKR